MSTDPGCRKVARELVDNDYRLADTSTLIGQGVVLPATLYEPLRPAADARPDIGALPHGRITAGSVRSIGYSP